MKIIKLFSIFFILFCLTIILQSCSNENLITTPTENKGEMKPIAKTVTLPTAKIDHAKDTIITLTKSKMTLVVSKSYSAKKIAAMDDYFSTHAISNTPNTQTVKPYYQWCPYHYDSTWVLQNKYASVSGKNLGIWTNEISVYQAHNQYGFTSFFVSGITDIDSAYNDGFSYDNLMWGLSPTDPQTQIDLSNSGGRHVGSYLVDEPFENDTWYDGQLIITAAADAGPSKRIMMSSYKWPTDWYDLQNNITYGDKYGSVMNGRNNIYIMCDEYYGNCWGHTYEYWNEFHGYYGSSKNISNWFHVVINNGNGSATSCGYAATSWITLLTTADGLGINEVWLYAYSTGDETAISNCCQSAWQDYWLLREQGNLVMVWQNTDGTCDWANGQWKLVDSYYDKFWYTYY